MTTAERGPAAQLTPAQALLARGHPRVGLCHTEAGQGCLETSGDVACVAVAGGGGLLRES